MLAGGVVADIHKGGADAALLREELCKEGQVPHAPTGSISILTKEN